MKTRVLLLLVAVALVALGIWLIRRSSAPPRTTPGNSSAAVSRGQKSEVAIQNGKTIDFSSGKPVFKDDAKDRAAMERGVAAINAAKRNVTFPATAPAPDKK